LVISSQKRVLDFLEWIYYDSSINLDRKYSMFCRLKKANEESLKGKKLVEAVKINNEKNNEKNTLANN
jgi:hypothetical protein